MNDEPSENIKIFLLCAIFESAVWGIAASKVVDAFSIMQHKSPDRERVSLPVLIASPLIFMLATIHLVGVIIRTYEGFIGDYRHPEDYFSLLTSRENTACQAGQVGAILVSDLLSVYRVWIICDRGPRPGPDDRPPRPFPFKRFVIPALGFLTTLASAIVWLNTQRTINAHESFYESRVYKWTLTFLATGLFTTATSTGLIADRLWRLDRQVEKTSSYRSRSPAGRALLIFVESAALYSLNNLLYMAFYAGKVKGLHSVFSTLSSSIASITFSLITIRGEKALRPDSQNSHSRSTHHELSSARPSITVRRSTVMLGVPQVPHLDFDDNYLPPHTASTLRDDVSDSAHSTVKFQTRSPV